MALRSKVDQQSKVFFLKIKVSNPIVRTSSFFEEKKYPVLEQYLMRSDAVSAKGLDVITKLVGIEYSTLEPILKEFDVYIKEQNVTNTNRENFLDVVSGEAIVNSPLWVTPSQRCVGYYMIKVEKELVEDTIKRVLTTPAQQLFRVEDEYPVWAVYVGGTPEDCSNQLRNLYGDKTFARNIKDGFWAFFLTTHISKEGATSKTLAKEIREMIELAKGEQYYSKTAFDIMMVALECEFTIKDVLEKIKRPRSTVYDQVSKLLKRGFLITKQEKKTRNLTYTINPTKFQGLSWIRSLQ